jgi:uncharacterized integral membrane protein
MSVLLFMLGAAFLLLMIFAAANWTAMTTPVTLSLLVADVNGPLGLVMLLITLGLALVTLAFAATWRTSMLMDSRRLSRELQAQRDVADRAEASRLSELRSYVERELTTIRSEIQGVARAATERDEARDATVQRTVREAVNSLLSSLGEVEDKLDRVLARPQQPPA